MRRMIWLDATLRLDAVGLLEADLFEDGGAGGAHLGLLGRVDLEHAVVALDDLHARLHLGGLEGHVGEPVDLDAGRDLDRQRGVTRERQEALRDGAQEGRVLGLQAVDE